MSYIRIIPPEEASEELARQYKRGANPDGTVDNVILVHGVNPKALAAHLELYIAAMHLPSPLSRAEREMAGVETSRLNGCGYCLHHHAEGLHRLLPEDRKTVADALRDGSREGLSDRERAIVEYAAKLTEHPEQIGKGDIDALRDAGLDDRAIHDLVQVVAYFAYANRIVLGLGAELEEAVTPGQWPEVGGAAGT